MPNSSSSSSYRSYLHEAKGVSHDEALVCCGRTRGIRGSPAIDRRRPGAIRHRAAPLPAEPGRPHEHHRPTASRQARLRGPRKELGPCSVRTKAIVGCVRSAVAPVAAVAPAADRGTGRDIVRDPLFELDFAIKNKDEAKFTEYYGHLTDACNACHQAALQTPVVIQDPKESMFPDQDFRPKQ